MSNISINVLGITSVIPKIKSVRLYNFEDVRRKIDSTRCNLDSRISNTDNIDNDIKKIERRIENIEDNLYILERILSMACENYDNAENSLEKNVGNILGWNDISYSEYGHGGGGRKF